MAKEKKPIKPEPPAAEQPDQPELEPAPNTDWVHSIEIKRILVDDTYREGRE